MDNELDARIFKEFLQYDLASGSLWEIVEIFERHRARFKEQARQYQEEIAQAQQELRALRERISQEQEALQNAKTTPKRALAKASAKGGHAPKPKDEYSQNAYQQRILELELENKRFLSKSAICSKKSSLRGAKTRVPRHLKIQNLGS